MELSWLCLKALGTKRGGRAISYSYRIYSSMAEVDRQAWNTVCASGGDLFTDARFVSAVEASMRKDTECWPVVVEDEAGNPVAVTCLSLYRVDSALLMGPGLKRIVQSVRRIWTGYLRFRILFCGLPVSAGQKTLFVIPGADCGKVLEAIDTAICGLARQLRVRLIVWKEFGPADCRWLAPLRNRGYIQADSLPVNRFKARFATFDAYVAALKKSGRRNIARSQRKFRDGGLRVVRMRGDEGFDRLYTDDVHQLYEAVLAHSETRLERLPAEFFREIARQFGKDAYFTLVYEGERIVAFLCSLADAQQFCILFLGMDYARNQTCDLYFNAIYDSLDCAFRIGVANICLGQNSPTFKARIGCCQESRAFFLKARGLLRLPLWLLAPLLFPPIKALPPAQVFRVEEPPGQSSPAGRPTQNQPQ